MAGKGAKVAATGVFAVMGAWIVHAAPWADDAAKVGSRYVDDAGRYVDDAGRYVDDAGRHVDDAGGYVDDAGGYVDDAGGYVDDAGGYVDDASRGRVTLPAVPAESFNDRVGHAARPAAEEDPASAEALKQIAWEVGCDIVFDESPQSLPEIVSYLESRAAEWSVKFAPGGAQEVAELFLAATDEPDEPDSALLEQCRDLPDQFG
jgi:hypothetical protein